MKPYSGDILYIENRTNVTRATNQIEDFKLFLSFKDNNAKLTTDFNVSPYHDDFDEAKKFLNLISTCIFCASKRTFTDAIYSSKSNRTIR